MQLEYADFFYTRVRRGKEQRCGKSADRDRQTRVPEECASEPHEPQGEILWRCEQQETPDSHHDQPGERQPETVHTTLLSNFPVGSVAHENKVFEPYLRG